MSRKPRKMVTMSKDMFMIFMTWAWFIGWATPNVYIFLTERFGG